MSKGRKSNINHAEVLAFASANPTLPQKDIGKRFGISQGRVSILLKTAGIPAVHRGRPCKQKPGESNQQHEWERLLQSMGLGMHRGTRLNKQRILYGYDPRKQEAGAGSATQNY